MKEPQSSSRREQLLDIMRSAVENTAKRTPAHRNYIFSDDQLETPWLTNQTPLSPASPPS